MTGLCPLPHPAARRGSHCRSPSSNLAEVGASIFTPRRWQVKRIVKKVLKLAGTHCVAKNLTTRGALSIVMLGLRNFSAFFWYPRKGLVA